MKRHFLGDRLSTTGFQLEDGFDSNVPGWAADDFEGLTAQRLRVPPVKETGGRRKTALVVPKAGTVQAKGMSGPRIGIFQFGDHCIRLHLIAVCPSARTGTRTTFDCQCFHMVRPQPSIRFLQAFHLEGLKGDGQLPQGNSMLIFEEQ